MADLTMSKTPAKRNTTRPQQLAGAAIHGGTGATGKVAVKAMYLVGACPVLHDHEVYEPGDELELTDAEAARLEGKVEAVKA